MVRSKSNIDVMLVTKYLDDESFRQLDHFYKLDGVGYGENRWPQLSQRLSVKDERPFYFIGPLQLKQMKKYKDTLANKVVSIASIWRDQHLRWLCQHAPQKSVLLQINGANRVEQGGVDLAEVASVLVKWRDKVEIKGVMSFGIRDNIKQSIALYQRIIQKAKEEEWFPNGGVFSLGMSLDWYETIEGCHALLGQNDRLLLRVGRYIMSD
ncbi:MAG: hypothetical protein ACON5A_00730 [Candidatus Comchoanobacterales bacterium]